MFVVDIKGFLLFKRNFELDYGFATKEMSVFWNSRLQFFILACDLLIGPSGFRYWLRALYGSNFVWAFFVWATVRGAHINHMEYIPLCSFQRKSQIVKTNGTDTNSTTGFLEALLIRFPRRFKWNHNPIWLTNQSSGIHLTRVKRLSH